MRLVIATWLSVDGSKVLVFLHVHASVVVFISAVVMDGVSRLVHELVVLDGHRMLVGARTQAIFVLEPVCQHVQDAGLGIRAVFRGDVATSAPLAARVHRDADRVQAAPRVSTLRLAKFALVGRLDADEAV